MTVLSDLLVGAGVGTTGPLPADDGPGLPTRLTTAGVPWEVSVALPLAGGPARLRVLVETGDHDAATTDRLTAQRRDLSAWSALVGPPEVVDAVDAFVATALPDPAAVTRPAVLCLIGAAFAGDRVAAVKAYASLRAAPGARDRLVARWPGLGADDDGSFDAVAVPYAASLGVGGDGARTVVYREVEPGHEHQVVDRLDRVHGTRLMAGLDHLGLGRLLWRGPVHVSVERPEGTATTGTRIGVDLCLDRAGPAGAAAVRSAAAVALTTRPDPLIPLFGDPAAPRLTLTWVGLEAPEGGEVDRLTVYGTITTTVRDRPVELGHV